MCVHFSDLLAFYYIYYYLFSLTMYVVFYMGICLYYSQTCLIWTSWQSSRWAPVLWPKTSKALFGPVNFSIFLRDRPFNLQGGGMVFWFVQNFFFGQHKSYIIFFVAQSANFFLLNVTLGYMTKTLNQIIIFFLHQTKISYFGT
jgi:hypothetical protein